MSYYDEVKTADSLIEELRTRIAELETELAHQKLLTEDSENHAAFETELNRKSLARAEQAEAAYARLQDVCEPIAKRCAKAEAERDAAWELVEELDPHHLKRNQMGMRQPRRGGGG